MVRDLGSRHLVGVVDGVLMADPMRGTRSDQPLSRLAALRLCSGVKTGAHRGDPRFILHLDRTVGIVILSLGDN